MQRAHRIRLNPTPEQQAYFRKAAGTARFVYNWGLADCGQKVDRDLNAACNIRDEALRVSAVPGVVTSAREIACGRGVRSS